VVRGMHFQLPPHDHEKLVYVTAGSILDVVVDLRRTSGTYGQVFSVELVEHQSSLFIPRGFAHGFLALSPNATVVYNVATGYQPTADAGIRWDSLGFAWPVAAPIMSDRDAAFPSLAEFSSPF
jgi:dTDP-4-dehydrorhamnose 3,5-epimerase